MVLFLFFGTCLFCYSYLHLLYKNVRVQKRLGHRSVSERKSCSSPLSPNTVSEVRSYPSVVALHTFIVLPHIKAIIPIIARVNHPIIPDHEFFFMRSSAMNMSDVFFRFYRESSDNLIFTRRGFNINRGRGCRVFQIQ